MRIISDFGDYYDTAMGFGQDTELIYLRKPRELVYGFSPHVSKSYEERRNTPRPIADESDNGYSVHPYIVGFCGKLYPMIQVSYRNKRSADTYTGWEYYYTRESFFAYEEYQDFLRTFKVKKKKKVYYPWYSFGASLDDNIKAFLRGRYYTEYEEFFQTYKVPLFVVDLNPDKYKQDRVVMLNCELKPFKFYKIFDSYRAFQEISMYISGVLGVGEPNTVEISNDDMRDKKGFDDKSFKQVSPGKKHRRRKRK